MRRQRRGVRYLLGWMFYRHVSLCWCCGSRPGPCPGHEDGGTIQQWRGRKLTPWWVGHLVDCRWY